MNAFWRHRLWLLRPFMSPAPQRQTISDAMQETRDEIERRAAQERAAPAAHAEFLHAQTEREQVQRLERDVRRFGSEAVQCLRRRSDPTFTLPENLRNIPADEPHHRERRRKSEKKS